jgi:hypothetical protein
MSQNPYANPYPQQYAQPYPPGMGMAPPARTSVMAVLSLVCSLLCCIPGISVLGVLFGGLALLAIAMSGGKVRGVGLAIAGLIIGIIVSVLWIGSAWFILVWAGQLGHSTEGVLTGIQDRDRAALSDALTTTAEAQLTDERVREFGDILEADLGQYDRAPDGFGEWIAGWSSLEDEKAESAMQRASDQYDDVMPVPMMYDGEWAMFFIIFSEGTVQTTAEGPTMVPEFRDIGFLREDGSIEWLVNGNDGGGTATIPIFTPPQLPDLDEDDPDLDPQGDEPAADEPDEDPEDEPAPGNRRTNRPKA